MLCPCCVAYLNKGFVSFSGAAIATPVQDVQCHFFKSIDPHIFKMSFSLVFHMPPTSKFFVDNTFGTEK